MISGWAVEFLQKSAKFSDVQAYRSVFFCYSLLGLTKFALIVMLSEKVELEVKPQTSPDQDRTHLMQDFGEQRNEDEADNNGNPSIDSGKKVKKIWLPSISPSSRLVVLQLCILFGMDSFGSGLAPLSWVSYFFNYKFGLTEGKLGTLFFVSTIIASGSQLVASSISKRIGNVKVSKHLPSIFSSLF